MRTDPNCVFCQIVAGKSPARVRYLDNDIIVIVNRLDWVPLMLLVMPKEHLSQIGMWDSDLLPRLGRLAVDMGAMYSPNGFRILSNFGRDGLQSQSHGHLHVVGGTFLGHYVEHDIFSSSVPSPYPGRVRKVFSSPRRSPNRQHTSQGSKRSWLKQSFTKSATTLWL